MCICEALRTPRLRPQAMYVLQHLEANGPCAHPLFSGWGQSTAPPGPPPSWHFHVPQVDDDGHAGVDDDDDDLELTGDMEAADAATKDGEAKKVRLAAGPDGDDGEWT